MKKKIAIIACIILFIIFLFGLYCLYEYTELFGKKIIPITIDSVSVQYTPGYDMKEATVFNEDEKKTIEIQTLKLKGDNLKAIKKCLRKVKKGKNVSGDIFHDSYDVIVNDKITVQMGDGIGYVQKGKNRTKVTIPSRCYEEVGKLVEKNNKKVVKTLSSETYQIKIDGASINVQNKDNKEYLQDALSYYPVSIDAPYDTYEEGYKAELILDSDRKVYFYSEKIGYILQKEGEQDTSTYVVFINDLYDLVNQIYQKSIADEKN